jgi:uncharacterized protein YmfQ (DUF2313 family)
MSHKDVLKQLFPIDLDGVFQDDINLEGQNLDNARSSAEDLLDVMFLSGGLETFLSDWERVFNIVPASGDTPELRKERIIAALRKVGGLSKPYFIQLADSLGYTVTITDNIEEFRPFMTGWGRSGDRLYKYEVIWIWKVHVINRTLHYFEAGISEAGNLLLTWQSDEELESLFTELKPAHTYVLFDYS